MDYFAYHFKVEPVDPGAEILMAVLSEKNFESFENTPDGFTAYITEENNNSLDLSDIHFEELNYGFTKEKIEKKNWNEEWEKNFEPVVVGNRLRIRAPFHASDPSFQQEIIIMPKMSFGTGHHQTTRLICSEMFEMDLKNKRVLDMGCGTGILAILAKRLGSMDVTGIDIDEWSVENSKENCEVNACPDIKVYLGDVDLLEKEKEFDIILANINRNILSKQIAVYFEKTKKNGHLLLSGFFKTDVDELKMKAEAVGFTFLHSSTDGEWAMIHLQK